MNRLKRNTLLHKYIPTDVDRPAETVTPKSHLLEDHAVNLIEKWYIQGQQGAESIHQVINEMKVNFRSMPQPVQRMRALLKEHYTRIHPDSVRLVPRPKKRKSNLLSSD